MRLLVLLVEDHPEARAAVKALLVKQGGYDVVEAEDAEAALMLVDSRAPAVVVADIHLPRASGIELADRLQRYNVPVVLLTAAKRAPDGSTWEATTRATVVHKLTIAEELLPAIGRQLAAAR